MHPDDEGHWGADIVNHLLDQEGDKDMLPAKGVKERVEGVRAVGKHRRLIGEENDAALLEKTGFEVRDSEVYGF